MMTIYLNNFFLTRFRHRRPYLKPVKAAGIIMVSLTRVAVKKSSNVPELKMDGHDEAGLKKCLIIYCFSIYYSAYNF
jgi:hypothetical protein